MSLMLVTGVAEEADHSTVVEAASRHSSQERRATVIHSPGHDATVVAAMPTTSQPHKAALATPRDRVLGIGMRATDITRHLVWSASQRELVMLPELLHKIKLCQKSGVPVQVQLPPLLTQSGNMVRLTAAELVLQLSHKRQQRTSIFTFLPRKVPFKLQTIVYRLVHAQPYTERCQRTH